MIDNPNLINLLKDIQEPREALSILNDLPDCYPEFSSVELYKFALSVMRKSVVQEIFQDSFKAFVAMGWIKSENDSVEITPEGKRIAESILQEA